MGLFVWDSEPSKIFVGDTPISKVFVWDTQVRPSGWWGPVQTFDFQNDWSLNWTGGSFYWTPSYVTWEWRTLGTSYTDTQSYITPPSSVYDGSTLQKVKIRIYKWISNMYDGRFLNAVWAWVGRPNSNWGFVWSNPNELGNNDILGYTGGYVLTANITWEVLIEADYTWATLIVTINWNVYNTTENSSLTKSDWSNNFFGLRLWDWRWGSSNIYIRKVQIFTE